jgi:hypothetical protein
MPITCPEALTSAPPLLPGLIGALVWIAPGSAAAVRPWPARPGVAGSVTARSVAEMIPWVTLPDRPSGLQPRGIVGADHREVVGRVGADQPRGARGGVSGHLNLEFRGVPRDMSVRDDVPGPVEDHAGSEPVGGPDQHHRGEHLPDHARVAVRARVAARSHGP